MDPKVNKPSTPSRGAKKEEDYLEEDECRTAVETESLTDASINRVPSPVKQQQSPRDAWANVAPSSQPRIVPATRLSAADREAEEIATSTARALETLRTSSDPRSRLFVGAASPAPTTTPQRAATKSSPFKPFSGHGRPLASPFKAASNSSGVVRTAAAASPAPSSVRTAAARSPDVRTGLEHSGRSARMREQRDHSAARSSRSDVSTATSVGRATPKKARKTKSGCATLHTATANYEIDLRQRSNSMTAPTTSVSTARTISPAARSSRSGRSPARPFAAATVQQAPVFDADYPPLPSEGDPNEQVVELVDSSQKYTPHIARPILFGTSGVNTARNISPSRTRTLSERTARGCTDTASLKTSRSPSVSQSENSVRTARSAHGPSPVNSLGSYNANTPRVRNASVSRSHHKSAPQSSLGTTSARSFASNKSWATAPNKTPCRKNLRSAHKSASETPATVSARSTDFSSKSSSASRGPRSALKSAAKSKAKTPLRTAAMNSARSTRTAVSPNARSTNIKTAGGPLRTPAKSAAKSKRSTRTGISPDAVSTKRSPVRPARADVRPITPDTPRGWPYRASEQRQTPIRIAPHATSVKTAAARSPRQAMLKSAKSPALRSQKELHREAKSASSKSRSDVSRRSNNPTSNVSTARTINSRLSAPNDRSAKELRSSKSNARTLSPSTLKAAKRDPVAVIDDSPDMVIETVQAHGNIEIDLCFNFRVRAPPGQGFGESRSPLKPKEVLINGKPIWRKE